MPYDHLKRCLNSLVIRKLKLKSQDSMHHLADLQNVKYLIISTGPAASEAVVI